MTNSQRLPIANAFNLGVTASKVISISALEETGTLDVLKAGSYLVLGSATNIILDECYDGTVITVSIADIALGEGGIISVGAGLPWEQLIEYCLTKNLYGIENLTLIPGLVGAAPVQNIGAYGVEVSSVIESVTCYNFLTKKIDTLNNKECNFSYRESIFQSKNYLILRVQFCFNQLFLPNLSYPSLQEFLDQENISRDGISPRTLSNIIQSIRESKLPSLDKIPNVGSIFKNPIVQTNSIAADFLQGHQWIMPDGLTKLSAARLLELVVSKIEIPSSLGFYEKHSLVLINKGGAVFSETTKLLKDIQYKVHELYGIQLQIEPEILGF